VFTSKLQQVYHSEMTACCKIEYRAGADSKVKNIWVFALALSPIYQAELAGSFSFQHIEITTGETEVFLAISVCSNLAFLGSGG